MKCLIFFAVATYEYDFWEIIDSDRKKIEAFEMWCKQRLLHISWREKMINAHIKFIIGEK